MWQLLSIDRLGQDEAPCSFDNDPAVSLEGATRNADRCRCFQKCKQSLIISTIINSNTSLTNTGDSFGVKPEVPPFHFIAECLVIDFSIDCVKSKPFAVTIKYIAECAKKPSRLAIKDVVNAGGNRPNTGIAGKLTTICVNAEARESRKRHCATPEYTHWFAVEFEGAIYHL